ncbi:MAG: pyridoxamine 5'-phosphate oxidase family protein [Treponema sp.]|jgi:nitroimidazol reductase NimA-like FMN-containing flavoprotein (pyridoxamine 5'-phosphate oxidase superfamily)|nr:pyridoxamine 5'-phosphate oxidase family protein [Treponema sp.]
MRRFDREITDKTKIKEFIQSEQILRVSFYDEGEIYIVPVNYGFSSEGKFYFHGAKAGRKYELAKKNPSVGFEIDGKYKLISGETACDYSAKFQSVIGTGRLCLVEDESEKILGLNAIMKQTTSKSEWNYSSQMLDSVAIFRLDVEKMSCKAK